MALEDPKPKLPADLIVIDKKGAAQRQLETAIMVWFNMAEPVSVHTLAVAANDCYRAMGEHAGKPPSMVKDWMKTLSAQHRNVILHAQNFFKHGFKNLKGNAVFTTLHAELMMIEAANYHELLFGKLTPLMIAFAIRFVGENPQIVTGGQQTAIRQIINAHPLQGVEVDDLLKLRRSEFLALLVPALTGDGDAHIESP